MPQVSRPLRTGMVLLAAVSVLSACGRNVPRETEQAMAPVRVVVEQLSKHPKWSNVDGRCLCVGHFGDEEGVEDFPPSLIDDVRSRHTWVHNWSECASYYGRKIKLKGCGGGKTDYICLVVDRSNLPPGTTRVLCHAAGENKALQYEFLHDDYDVSEKDGVFTARPVSQNALMKLYE